MPRLKIFSSGKNNFRKQAKGGMSRSTSADNLIGEIFTVQIHDIASNGRAVARLPSGLAVFIPGAWLGETVTVRITAAKNNFAQAELLSVEVRSEHRIEPLCRHFGAGSSKTNVGDEVPDHGVSGGCGGCSWQFVDYAAQLKIKQRWVVKAFEEMVASPASIQSIVAGESPWAYRNRAELKTDGVKLGFLSANSHDLIDVFECRVMTPAMQDRLSALREQLANTEWQPSNHQWQPSNKRQPKKTHKRKQKMPLNLLAIDETMAVGEFRFNTRLDFQQGNASQNLLLKRWLVESLDVNPGKHSVLELFAGAGNFTAELIKLAPSKLVAVEVSPSAMKSLNQLMANAPSGHQYEAMAADLFDESKLETICRRYADFDCLVLDPPREGLFCIQPLLDMPNLKRIAYISCDLATCARDVKKFVEAGYVVDRIQPVDMFPQTPHVELCVLMTR